MEQNQGFFKFYQSLKTTRNSRFTNPDTIARRTGTKIKRNLAKIKVNSCGTDESVRRQRRWCRHLPLLARHPHVGDPGCPSSAGSCGSCGDVVRHAAEGLEVAGDFRPVGVGGDAPHDGGVASS
jgi:hypothetical protein